MWRIYTKHALTPAADGTEWGPQPKYDDPRVQNHIIDAVVN